MRATKLLVIVAMLFASCTSIRHTYQYQPEIISGAPQTSLRIAVLPFKEERRSINEGSGAWAYIPLVPTAAHREDSPQSEIERSQAEYFYPDLVPYGIAKDLLENRIGQAVHFNPETIDDYDLIIDGSLRSTQYTDRTITYGVGPLGFVFWMFGFPKNPQSVDFVAEYRVRNGAGKELYKQEIQESWTTTHGTLPRMEGVNETIRDANTKFLKAVLSVIASQDKIATAESRNNSFYYALDRELPFLEKELAQMQGSVRSADARYFNALNQEIRKRKGWLEKYRNAERKITNKQQLLVYAKQDKRIAAVNSVKEQQRLIEEQQAQAQHQVQHAQNRAVAGALLAGLVPAYNVAAADGGWNSAATATALQNAGESMANISPETFNAQAPDYSAELSQLSAISLDGLESGGANPFQDLRGGSIKEIRAKFLAKYERLVTPLPLLRARAG